MLQLDYKDDESSIGDRAIHNASTIKTLEALGVPFDFIGIWLKLHRENFNTRCEAYINAMNLCSCKYLKLLK